MDAVTARRALDAALSEPARLDAAALTGLPLDTLDETLRGFVDAHGAAALPVLQRLAGERLPRELRRSARLALYRLAQHGVQASPPVARPVLGRRADRAVRAWLSAIDGSGSRAVWILFETPRAFELCSLIVNDEAGVMDVAGGEITKKRLETELAALRASQKLPWIEVEPARALTTVGEALAAHQARGTTPPAGFARWERRFTAAEPAPLPAREIDPARAEQAPALLELPEMAGWFLEPETVHADALELLQARDSKLVVSDQSKAEREAALVTRVVERELDGAARRRWARRLDAMVFVFEATGRPEQAAVAGAAAAALADDSRPIAGQPFARGLAQRALELAGEVALGKISAADVSRKPGAS